MKSTHLVRFETFTKLPFIMFRTIGVLPFQTAASKNESASICTGQIIPWTIFYLTYINLGLLVLGEMIYFVLNFGKFSSFVELTSVTLCIGFIWLSFAKVASIIWNRDYTNTVIAELNEMFPQTLWAQNDYQVHAHELHTKRIMIGYSALQMVMIWLFNLYPLSDTIVEYVRDGTWNVDFPYIIWYPFDPYVSGWFEVNFLSQIWAGYVAAAGILATDLLLCSIVLQICMHFDRLCVTLVEMEPPPPPTSHVIGNVGICPKKSALLGNRMSIEQSIKVHNKIMKYKDFIS